MLKVLSTVHNLPTDTASLFDMAILLSVVTWSVMLIGPTGLQASASDGGGESESSAVKYIPMQVTPSQGQMKYASMMIQCILRDGIEKTGG